MKKILLVSAIALLFTGTAMASWSPSASVSASASATAKLDIVQTTAIDLGDVSAVTAKTLGANNSGTNGLLTVQSNKSVALKFAASQSDKPATTGKYQTTNGSSKIYFWLGQPSGVDFSSSNAGTCDAETTTYFPETAETISSTNLPKNSAKTIALCPIFDPANGLDDWSVDGAHTGTITITVSV